MTAVLELVMPETCAKCSLKIKQDSAWYCIVSNKRPLCEANGNAERACFCPLRTLDEYSELIRPKARAVATGENGNIYCPSCKRKIGAFRGKQYCPDCGQRLEWEAQNG